MALHGYAGKVLVLDLTRRQFSSVPTAKYRAFGGGHGLGSALFWDFCPDKTIRDGRHPANVCVVATSPLTGTIVPSAGGRCEVVGVGVGQYPWSWYTRSGFGGRFSTLLKYAGWDAIVIAGRADAPVWVDVLNGKVTFRDAAGLWGKDTFQTQHQIWDQLASEPGTPNQWRNQNADVAESMSAATDQGATTQRPAILTIGPAGENQTCQGALIHDQGNGAGQCGFGAVWGSKNLKAISVMGTGGITVADPAALLKARFALKERYSVQQDHPDFKAWTRVGGLPRPITQSAPPTQDRRPQSCQSCVGGCRARYNIGYGNESACQETAWYLGAISKVAKDKQQFNEWNIRAADVVQRYGFNSFVFQTGLHWIMDLYHHGHLGPGKAIHSDLPWKELGTVEFAEKMVEAISNRKDIGADLADGWVQAAHKWGRAGDLADGTMQFSYWGMPDHGYDPRAELEWGYGSILDARDINEHCFNGIFTSASAAFAYGMPLKLEAKDVVRLVAEKLGPYARGRGECLDYSQANMYSEPVAQLVRWHRHYTRFYKQSALFCDLKWPDFYNTNRPDQEGATASADCGEQVFWNAVTGDALSFEDGIALGRRIWNLDNAIWTLQGRHRDLVHFAPYIYGQEYKKGELFPFFMWPGRDQAGEWEWQDLMGKKLDRKRFDDWKTIFYGLEGWDPATGWPTRRTLEEVGLPHVADALASVSRLGKEAP